MYKRQAKEILAYELTKLVHGEEEAKKAKEASHALFAGGGVSAHMPTVEVTAEDLYNDCLLYTSGCIPCGKGGPSLLGGFLIARLMVFP